MSSEICKCAESIAVWTASTHPPLSGYHGDGEMSACVALVYVSQVVNQRIHKRKGMSGPFISEYELAEQVLMTETGTEAKLVKRFGGCAGLIMRAV